MISLKNYLDQGQTILSNLVIENYHRLGMSNEEFILWLQLFRYRESGNLFPDLAPIAKNMEVQQQEIYRLLNQLVEKKLIKIESMRSLDGRLSDFYDFYPTFEKIELLLKQVQQQSEQSQLANQIQTLYQVFETEFGRPLSPIEYQRIGQWLDDDNYQPELIHLALKEAVLSQAYSLNYIDRILISWERKNITTKEQVEAENKRRKRQILQKESPSHDKKLPKISMHNWLDEE